jgi:hypothetical protein
MSAIDDGDMSPAARCLRAFDTIDYAAVTSIRSREISLNELDRRHLCPGHCRTHCGRRYGFADDLMSGRVALLDGGIVCAKILRHGRAKYPNWR